LYADQVTESRKRALEETNRRREKQRRYNQEHGIQPASIVKSIRDLTQRLQLAVAEPRAAYEVSSEASEQQPFLPLGALPKGERVRLIKDLERQMHQAAEELRFEEAAMLRDQIIELRRSLQEDSDLPAWKRDTMVEIEEAYGLGRKPT
jgi:excinuclease ABC subunit B